MKSQQKTSFFLPSENFFSAKLPAQGITGSSQSPSSRIRAPLDQRFLKIVLIHYIEQAKKCNRTDCNNPPSIP